MAAKENGIPDLNPTGEVHMAAQRRPGSDRYIVTHGCVAIEDSEAADRHVARDHRTGAHHNAIPKRHAAPHNRAWMDQRDKARAPLQKCLDAAAFLLGYAKTANKTVSSRRLVVFDRSDDTDRQIEAIKCARIVIEKTSRPPKTPAIRMGLGPRKNLTAKPTRTDNDQAL